MDTPILIALISFGAVIIAAIPIIVRFIYVRTQNISITVKHRGAELKLQTTDAKDAERFLSLWIQQRLPQDEKDSEEFQAIWNPTRVLPRPIESTLDEEGESGAKPSASQETTPPLSDTADLDGATQSDDAE